MDRHVMWLRRRIVASIAAQTGITFGVAFALLTALLVWRTEESVMTSAALAFVLAQAFAAARVVQAMRTNPLTYDFLSRYTAAPHRYVIVDDDEDGPHEITRELLGFYHVITVCDPGANPSPTFDLYQTGDRMTTAAVSRASGAVTLYSRLADGRILVTDARVVIPHEGLAVNLVAGQHPARLIAAHRQATSQVPGGAEAEPRALRITSRALALEHDAYAQLGPLIGPFLDLEPHRPSLGRLIVTVTADELAALGPTGRPAGEGSRPDLTVVAA